MDPKFIHLRVHTEYSLVDSLVRIKPFIKSVSELQMPAVAVTDQSNMYALVKFYRAAQASGVKAILGADLLIQPTPESDEAFLTPFLVQNEVGYKNLKELISKGYQENQHQGSALVKLSWLKDHCDGLIALSGGMSGQIGQLIMAGKDAEAREVAEYFGALLPGRFYLEVQRVGKVGEEDYLVGAVNLASGCSLPVVATNDVRFLDKTQFEAHEARVCINQGRVLDDPRRPKSYTDQQYLRSVEEMCELFSDLPEAIENTVEIAKRCNQTLTLGKNYLPDFPVPEGMTTDEYFAQQSREGLEERLAQLFGDTNSLSEETRKLYEDRLEIELNVILQMGFPGYFLIVADFIQWAKNNGVPVGPGRGSGAGSLVAYVLKITDLDPIEFELLFERFLNPERVSMPDFDVDFCMEGRDRVIDYVAQHYGRDRVSQIITFGSMAAKAVVRDVGRVLGHPYGFVDRLAKLIPFEVGMTLTKALEESPDLKKLYDEDEEVQVLIDLALTLEGISRNVGKHAGGVVISPSRLTDFTPLYCEEGSSSIVSQFDKDDVEAVGLVKFDFLGLRTLTIINWALETINGKKQREGEDTVDINLIPRDDPASYDLLMKCQTTAVFQLESRGMKDLIRRLKPDCFEDIIALVALFRPGPLQSGMVDDYINVKHKVAKAEYAHPILEPILKPTNGVILYQEQVMQIARELAGYTLGGADLLRRAMGKKKPEEMAKQREIFTTGAVGLGVDEGVATYIFDLMEKFAGYGFNKSHSAAYALVAYQTAWLKAHYPAAFMAAVLSADMDNTDKVVILIDECRMMNLEILPPDVNRSAYRFTALDNGTIVYGLGAIKGVGQGAIEDIISNRQEAGEYRDLLDFCQRIDLRKANKRVLEAMVRAGAMDSLGSHRAAYLDALPTALKIAEQHTQSSSAGQDDLFGVVPDSQNETDSLNLSNTQPWPEDERLAGEKVTLGLYLTGHPINQWEPELEKFISGKIGRLIAEADRQAAKSSVRIAGLVVEIRIKQTQQGRKMAFVTLDDRSGRIDVAIYTDAFDEYGHLVNKDEVLVIEGGVSIDDYSGGLRMKAERIMTIAEARCHFAKDVLIYFDAGVVSRLNGGLIPLLKEALQKYSGGNCPISIDYSTDGARTRLKLGEQWRVSPDESLIHMLSQQLGSEKVKVRYPRR